MPSCGGAIGMWLYQSVLGIRPDPAGPGFKKFILAPQPDPASGLTSARGSYDSVHGRIVSKWTRENARFHTPRCRSCQHHGDRLRSGQGRRRSDRIRNASKQGGGREILRMDNNAAVYGVGSGTYRFESLLPAKIGQGTQNE